MIKNNIIEKYSTLDPALMYFPKCKEYYSIANISQFDHFLSNDEASELVVFYNGPNHIRYDNIEKRFLRAFSILFDNYHVYDYLYNSSENVEINQITDKELYLNKITIGLREINDFSFLIPSLSLIVLIDYDLEVIIYATDLDNIEKLFDACFKSEGFNLLFP